MSLAVFMAAHLLVWIALGWLLQKFVLKRPVTSSDIEAGVIYLLLVVAAAYAGYLQFFSER